MLPRVKDTRGGAFLFVFTRAGRAYASLAKLFDELLYLRVDGFLHFRESGGDVRVVLYIYPLDDRNTDLVLPRVDAEIEADRVYDDVDHLLGFVVAG